MKDDLQSKAVLFSDFFNKCEQTEEHCLYIIITTEGGPNGSMCNKDYVNRMSSRMPFTPWAQKVFCAFINQQQLCSMKIPAFLWDVLLHEILMVEAFTVRLKLSLFRCTKVVSQQLCLVIKPCQVEAHLLLGLFLRETPSLHDSRTSSIEEEEEEEGRFFWPSLLTKRKSIFFFATKDPLFSSSSSSSSSLFSWYWWQREEREREAHSSDFHDLCVNDICHVLSIIYAFKCM